MASSTDGETTHHKPRGLEDILQETEARNPFEIEDGFERQIFFETPPPDVVNTITKYFEAAVNEEVKRTDCGPLLQEATVSDSDSGDSLFQTQLVTPLVRSVRKRCSSQKSASFFTEDSGEENAGGSEDNGCEKDRPSAPSRQDAEGDSEGDGPNGAHREWALPARRASGGHRKVGTRRQQLRLRKTEFPFLERWSKRTHQTMNMRQVLENSAVGGFFECMKRHSKGEKIAGSNPRKRPKHYQRKLPPLSESELEEDSEEHEDNCVDIRVVDKVCFIPLFHKRNRQVWLPQSTKKDESQSRSKEQRVGRFYQTRTPSVQQMSSSSDTERENDIWSHSSTYKLHSRRRIEPQDIELLNLESTPSRGRNNYDTVSKPVTRETASSHTESLSANTVLMETVESEVLPGGEVDEEEVDEAVDMATGPDSDTCEPQRSLTQQISQTIDGFEENAYSDGGSIIEGEKKKSPQRHLIEESEGVPVRKVTPLSVDEEMEKGAKEDGGAAGPQSAGQNHHHHHHHQEDMRVTSVQGREETGMDLPVKSSFTQKQYVTHKEKVTNQDIEKDSRENEGPVIDSGDYFSSQDLFGPFQSQEQENDEFSNDDNTEITVDEESAGKGMNETTGNSRSLSEEAVTPMSEKKKAREMDQKTIVSHEDAKVRQEEDNAVTLKETQSSLVASEDEVTESSATQSDDMVTLNQRFRKKKRKEEDLVTLEEVEACLYGDNVEHSQETVQCSAPQPVEIILQRKKKKNKRYKKSPPHERVRCEGKNGQTPNSTSESLASKSDGITGLEDKDTHYYVPCPSPMQDSETILQEDKGPMSWKTTESPFFQLGEMTLVRKKGKKKRKDKNSTASDGTEVGTRDKDADIEQNIMYESDDIIGLKSSEKGEKRSTVIQQDTGARRDESAEVSLKMSTVSQTDETAALRDTELDTAETFQGTTESSVPQHDDMSLGKRKKRKQENPSAQKDMESELVVGQAAEVEKAEVSYVMDYVCQPEESLEGRGRKKKKKGKKENGVENNSVVRDYVITTQEEESSEICLERTESPVSHHDDTLPLRRKKKRKYITSPTSEATAEVVEGEKTEVLQETNMISVSRLDDIASITENLASKSDGSLELKDKDTHSFIPCPYPMEDSETIRREDKEPMSRETTKSPFFQLGEMTLVRKKGKKKRKDKNSTASDGTEVGTRDKDADIEQNIMYESDDIIGLKSLEKGEKRSTVIQQDTGARRDESAEVSLKMSTVSQTDETAALRDTELDTAETFQGTTESSVPQHDDMSLGKRKKRKQENPSAQKDMESELVVGQAAEVEKAEVSYVMDYVCQPEESLEGRGRKKKKKGKKENGVENNSVVRDYIITTQEEESSEICLERTESPVSHHDDTLPLRRKKKRKYITSPTSEATAEVVEGEKTEVLQETNMISVSRLDDTASITENLASKSDGSLELKDKDTHSFIPCPCPMQDSETIRQEDKEPMSRETTKSPFFQLGEMTLVRKKGKKKRKDKNSTASDGTEVGTRDKDADIEQNIMYESDDIIGLKSSEKGEKRSTVIQQDTGARRDESAEVSLKMSTVSQTDETAALRDTELDTAETFQGTTESSVPQHDDMSLGKRKKRKQENPSAQKDMESELVVGQAAEVEKAEVSYVMDYVCQPEESLEGRGRKKKKKGKKENGVENNSVVRDYIITTQEEESSEICLERTESPVSHHDDTLPLRRKKKRKYITSPTSEATAEVVEGEKTEVLQETNMISVSRLDDTASITENLASKSDGSLELKDKDTHSFIPCPCPMQDSETIRQEDKEPMSRETTKSPFFQLGEMTLVRKKGKKKRKDKNSTASDGTEVGTRDKDADIEQNIMYESDDIIGLKSSEKGEKRSTVIQQDTGARRDESAEVSLKMSTVSQTDETAALRDTELDTAETFQGTTESSVPQHDDMSLGKRKKRKQENPSAQKDMESELVVGQAAEVEKAEVSYVMDYVCQPEESLEGRGRKKKKKGKKENGVENNSVVRDYIITTQEEESSEICLERTESPVSHHDDTLPLRRKKKRKYITSPTSEATAEVVEGEKTEVLQETNMISVSRLDDTASITENLASKSDGSLELKDKDTHSFIPCPCPMQDSETIRQEDKEPMSRETTKSPFFQLGEMTLVRKKGKKKRKDKNSTASDGTEVGTRDKDADIEQNIMYESDDIIGLKSSEKGEKRSTVIQQDTGARRDESAEVSLKMSTVSQTDETAALRDTELDTAETFQGTTESSVPQHDDMSLGKRKKRKQENPSAQKDMESELVVGQAAEVEKAEVSYVMDYVCQPEESLEGRGRKKKKKGKKENGVENNSMVRDYIITTQEEESSEICLERTESPVSHHDDTLPLRRKKKRKYITSPTSEATAEVVEGEKTEVLQETNMISVSQLDYIASPKQKKKKRKGKDTEHRLEGNNEVSENISDLHQSDQIVIEREKRRKQKNKNAEVRQQDEEFGIPQEVAENAMPHPDDTVKLKKSKKKKRHKSPTAHKETEEREEEIIGTTQSISPDEIIGLREKRKKKKKDNRKECPEGTLGIEVEENAGRSEETNDCPVSDYTTTLTTKKRQKNKQKREDMSQSCVIQSDEMTPPKKERGKESTPMVDAMETHTGEGAEPCQEGSVINPVSYSDETVAPSEKRKREKKKKQKSFN